MEPIRIDPGEHYSLGVAYGPFAQTAGIVADDLTADLQGQARQVLAAIDGLLMRLGAAKSALISANIWLRDIDDFEKMNEVWDQWVDHANLPVRATVEARLADPRILVEIAVTAARPDSPEGARSPLW